MQSAPEGASDEIEIPLTETLLFPSLQRGRYSVQLLVPGASRRTSEWVELTDQPAEITAGLQPGADVKLEVMGATRDGDEAMIWYTLESLVPSRRMDEHRGGASGFWRGLPLGTYRIRSPLEP